MNRELTTNQGGEARLRGQGVQAGGLESAESWQSLGRRVLCREGWLAVARLWQVQDERAGVSKYLSNISMAPEGFRLELENVLRGEMLIL